MPLTWTLFTLVGCPKPAIPLGQTVVEDIRFEGNSKGLFATDSQGTLRDALETQQSDRFIDLPGRWDVGGYVGDIATVDETTLAEDRARIETWYAHHGWFDAKFLGWEVVPRRRPPDGVASSADLVGRLERGEPSLLDGAPELTGIGSLSTPIRKDLAKLVRLREGERFDLDAYRETLSALQGRLQERGYAYANVEGHVTVRPDLHQVHVRYAVDPGRACVFGEIAVRGETDPTALKRVLQELDFETGDGFRASKLVAARQRLYGLGVFGLVEVTPVLETPEERGVAVIVRLKRRDSRVIEAGLTFEIESNRQVVALGASYTDDNAFSKLWRWKAETQLGVASTVDFSLLEAVPLDEQVADSVSPTGSIAQTLTIPNIIGDKLALTASSDVHHDVAAGYRLIQASATPALSYTPDRRITTSLGYRLQYTKYYDFADLRAVKTTQLSVSVREESVLSMLQQKLSWDARDDKLRPTRNYYLALALDEAGGPFGGDEGFFRVAGDVRAYKGLRFGKSAEPHTVVAGRVGSGIIALYDPDGGVDIAERLQLGGGTTVRGWAEDRLGPHLCYNADTNAADLAADGSPQCVSTDIIEGVGGTFSLYGNFEVRQDLPWNFGMVAFLDVGRAWDKVENVAFDELQWSVGGGLRYRSPIGPIRADFGWVIDPDPYFSAESGWQVHLGIGEAF